MHSSRSTPFWLWPNILSLDAPFIAAVWQRFFALNAHVQLALSSRVALPAAVWMIYLIDRLLDTRHIDRAPVTARHQFCVHHRTFCYLLTALAAGSLGISLLHLPKLVVQSGFAVAAIVSMYLLLVHRVRAAWLPKEAAVAIVFATGTVLAPFVLAFNAMLLLPWFLFSVLCWLNCSAIDAGETGRRNWVMQHLTMTAAFLCILCLPVGFYLPAQDHSAFAIFIAAAGLWLVGNARNRLGTDALRVWMDVPLLSPLLLLGLR